ncbi:Hsp20/alpha crystallin family protein [Halorussus halophilus]|uniref:Hsp20/alpha crystallin family protein n=1 Tax=Halorussus halophilus TaxID=2650975 RepID=UPI00178823D3|nr:Hsp20/alpha crystallin family protein [Halorussus halophilus]
MLRRNKPPKRRRLPFRGPPDQAAIPVDVREVAEEYVVTADVPGIRKQDIDVKVKKNRVQIVVAPEERGEEGEQSRREGPFAQRAREQQPVSRTIRLPEWIDEKRTNAEYLDGALRITLPKREHRHRVEVE